MSSIKNIKEFVKTRTFLLNLGLAIAFIFLLLTATYFWLDSYTKHGETISVPDLRGMSPAQMTQFLSDKKLRFKVIDSSMYDPKKPKGSILDQDPLPNSKVKENRTIYLAINSRIPVEVKMPNLIDVSFRQAEAILETFGLKVGEQYYKPDLAKNAVLAQQFKGSPIAPGTLIPKGSEIDLVLGDGYGNTKVTIPNLIGQDLEEASFVIRASSLNLGEVIADASVKNKNAAIVYQQDPPASNGNSINQGEAITLYISQSPDKIKGIKK